MVSRECCHAPLPFPAQHIVDGGDAQDALGIFRKSQLRFGIVGSACLQVHDGSDHL